MFRILAIYLVFNPLFALLLLILFIAEILEGGYAIWGCAVFVGCISHILLRYLAELILEIVSFYLFILMTIYNSAIKNPFGGILQVDTIFVCYAIDKDHNRVAAHMQSFSAVANQLPAFQATNTQNPTASP